MSRAITKGMMVSITTSPTMNNGVRIVSLLYSRIHPANLFTICSP